MRYDTPVYFCRQTDRSYNYGTGDYEGGTATEELRFASVENTKADTLHLIYGELRQDSVTIHLQNHYDKPFDHIRIRNKKYKADYTRRLRFKQAIVVSEVMA